MDGFGANFYTLTRIAMTDLVKHYTTRSIILLAVFALGYFARPTLEPCITITHIGTDSFGERYTVQGGNWSGYMVTDRPVFLLGECSVRVEY